MGYWQVEARCCSIWEWRRMAGRRKYHGSLTLEGLICLMCFVFPMMFSPIPALNAKAGFGGFTLAIASGFAVGFLCAWAWSAANWAIRPLGRNGALWKLHISIQVLAFLAYFAVAMAWMIFAGFLGVIASMGILHLVS
jgi:hypothetical protein